MSERYIDGILAYVDGEMTQKYRELLVAELEQIDKDIIEFRAEMVKWEQYALMVKSEPKVPADLRDRTVARAERKRRLLLSTEKYRVYLFNEIFNQPSRRHFSEQAN